jgi:1-phosphatidylinositol phosphodiesterase
MKTGLLLSTIVALTWCAVPAHVQAATQGGYSHDSSLNISNPDWMSRLADNRLASWVMVPGTHDSGARVGGDIPQTQSMSIATQLTSGIRALDIRCVYKDGVLQIYHGPISQNLTFDSVLNEVTKFLDNHPREVIFMRVKNENNGNAEDFETSFQSYLSSLKWGSYFWVPRSGLDSNGSLQSPKVSFRPSENWRDFTNITIGDLRGKIVVLQEFVSTTSPPIQYGIDWNGIQKQDNYQLSTNWALYDKWDAVRDQLNFVNKTNDDEFHANFLSGSVGSFPYFVASGKSSPQTNAPLLSTGLTQTGNLNKNKYPDFPRDSCFLGTCTIYFLGTNQLTTDWLSANRNTGLRRGQLIFQDFPGPDLITREIDFNF